MAQAYQCDRCKLLFTGKPNIVAGANALATLATTGQPPTNLELCDSCNKQLQSVMSGYWTSSKVTT